MRATAPGSPFAQHGAIGCTTSMLIPRSVARRSNSAATARVSSPSSTGSERSGARVEPREVEQVGGQVLEPAQLALGARDLLVRVVEVDAPLAQVVVEQLEHPLEQRERSAQLVRRGGDEGAAGVLLAHERLLHRGERARQVADLVAGVVARRRPATPPLGTSSADWRRRSSRRRSAEARPPPSTSATMRPTSAAVRNAARTWSTVSPTSVSGLLATSTPSSRPPGLSCSGATTSTASDVVVRCVRSSISVVNTPRGASMGPEPVSYRGSPGAYGAVP